MSISLTKVGYVILYSRDVEKSAAFYRDRLGIPVKMASPEWTELATEGFTLALHRHDDPVAAAANQATVVFDAADVRATHAALRESGLDLSDLKEVWRGGPVVGLSSDFADPDGNRLSVHGTVPQEEWPA